MFIHGGYVYSVCEVCAYGVKAHLAADRVKFGTMDRCGETESLNCVEDTGVSTEGKMNFDEIFENDNIYVIYEGQTFKLEEK